MGRNAVLITLIMAAALSCANNELPFFDSERAFSYLEQQVEFGARVPGTSAHSETLDWMEAKLIEAGADTVIRQEFYGLSMGVEQKMTNLIGTFHSEIKDRIILCAHWDSRPIADLDPDLEKRHLPVPGANDGASGVAVLLEIASILGKEVPNYSVDIVFFDGEDGGDYGDLEGWCLGSKHFARVMPPSYRPRFAILLDMIGKKDLELTPDVYSLRGAPNLWKRITDICAKIGIPVSSEVVHIYDDHVPLLERWIPAVNVIDFNYPYWHTTMDTPDKCSSESLGKIGELVLTILYGGK